MSDHGETGTAAHPTGRAEADRWTIGVFAREVRLSIKALRLYDAAGLLVPRVRDPHSGYRFYHPDQRARAQLIALLRQLDMPLGQIADVLDLPAGQAAARIGRYWQQVEREQAVKRQLAQYLQRHLEGTGDTMFEVHDHVRPAQQVAALSANVPIAGLEGFLREARVHLFDALRGAGAHADHGWFVVFHGQVNEDSDGPVELCVPFEGHLQPAGQLVVRTDAAGRELYTTVTRRQWAFPGILEAYDAVATAIQRQGLQMAGAPREVYWTEPDRVDEDERVCTIAWPVQG
ncbi:MerR family transcriptional regulator [Deinococcus sonorensis]|uniref:MerR family transcriptional regulator n=2 Tax=Deinococcus sonorensis TaxID=309891 RepID=A0AAU7U6W1_9DEIO